MQKNWIPQELPRVVALPAGGGDAAGWEPAPVRSAGSGCGSGAGEPAPVRSAASGCVPRAGGPGFGDYLNHRLGTNELGYGLKPPNHTAPAGLTESGHPTGCVPASLGHATTRGIPL